MRYAIVIEKADNNYSAYVPDLPGCVATGETVGVVGKKLREAIRFHIEGFEAQDGLADPAPTSIAKYDRALEYLHGLNGVHLRRRCKDAVNELFDICHCNSCCLP